MADDLSLSVLQARLSDPSRKNLLTTPQDQSPAGIPWVHF